MKKKILIITILLLFLTGCDFTEDFNDRHIYTTMYPLEYATNEMYSEYAKVTSVYPNGSDEKFEVTDKKKHTYSEGEIFVYAGVANEASLARDLINLNSKLKIIDATKGMQSSSLSASIWLDPSNYLMSCSNIKKNLIDLNDNVYIKDNIEEKYKKLNEKISELDVLLYDIGRNGNYNTVLVTNNVFNYLSKYNINVISLDEKNESIDKSYADAKKLIKDKKIQYIFYLEGDAFNPNQEKLINDNSLVKIEINNIFSLTDEERQNDKNYLTIMHEIIDNYKKELYKK